MGGGNNNTGCGIKVLGGEEEEGRRVRRLEGM